ncbi:MAG: anthranilate phosphoribosyltransferase, partial [Chloroflexi bacterium AL-W]|nr:anthranilate phosphoribosyltransferase [Chloroflexi bacterium AL-W]
LTNPAGARRQLMGVFAPDLTDLIAHVLGELGSKSAMVVCGYGGLDELTTTGPNQISYYNDGVVTTYDLDPLDYGFPGANISELLGDDAPTNAAILRGILSGDVTDAKRDVVLLNAGAALVVAGKADDIAVGIKLAREVIETGAALDKLEKLITFSHQIA